MVLNRTIVTILLTFTVLSVLARTYTLDGTIAGKYPIVVELEEHEDGL